jgi:ABC-type dipeptide/oligopeptide/nickel transport system permease subunit
MELMQAGLLVLSGFVLGAIAIWRLSKRKTTTRAEALKIAHALFVEAMKLPGAEDAKVLADAQLVVENLAAKQLADAIAKGSGVSAGS